MGRSINSDGEIVNYEAGMMSFTSRLYNKCSLMKFNVTTPSTAAICITGMKNEVTVHFDNPTDSGFDYNMNTTDGGLIKMKGQEGNGTKTYWAIVLPQVALTETGEAYSEDQNYIGTRPTIHAIEANKYYHEGDDVINMEVNTLNPDGPLATPLTLEALTDGTIVVNDPRSGMQYTLNGGAKTTMSGTTTINVVAGDKVAFYGNGTSITSYNGTIIAGGTASVKAYGNTMSLINETDFATCTTLPNQEVFTSLFENNVHLTDASDLLLPAMTLANECYEYMFSSCTALTAAPALPAMTLANECYLQMFYGCSSLTAAPELPAMELKESCYSGMFHDCSNLSTPPALPATTLASRCYYMMFYNCSSLTAAPVLPAPTMVTDCYNMMFYSCWRMSSITCLATSGIDENGSTNRWLYNVAGNGKFTKASNANWPEGNSGIPIGWTVISQ